MSNYVIMASIFRDDKTSNRCITCKKNLSYIKEGLYIAVTCADIPKKWSTDYKSGDLWFCSDGCTEVFIANHKELYE